MNSRAGQLMFVLAAVLGLWGWRTHAQTSDAALLPAQYPLLSRSGAAVKPNVMITFDDSGSMWYQHMPEGSAKVGKWQVNFPAEFRRFHPADGGTQASWPGESRVISGVPQSKSWMQRLLRSPDANTIYYNPEVRYRPWIGVDGQRYAEASFTQARLDPDQVQQGTVDLSKTGQVDATWCAYPSAKVDECYVLRNKQNYDPGLFYRLRKDGDAWKDPKDPSSYEEFSVNTTMTFTRYPQRSDCSPLECTRSEEQKNFANWFVYHRSRMLMAKAGIGEAFFALDDVFRLGWGSLGKSAGTLDGVPEIAVIESGVRDYSESKAAFFNWLYGLKGGSSTRLRLAMQSVGDYYSSTAKTGPWSDTPGVSSTTPQKSCRRAYHLMVTDGYWTDEVNANGLRSVGNKDNEAGLVITGPGNQSFQYKPARPFLDDWADRLADYAMNYWARDLRPDLENKVSPTPSNPAFWQHMSNFIVGLGVSGSLDPKKDLPAVERGDQGKSWGADKIDDLWHAAINSRGEFMSARNPVELQASVSSALRSAVERDLREAGVATASSILESDSRKYVPRYRTGSWSGDVEAYVLDESGQTGVLAWSAKDKLPPWTSRNIVTWDGQGARPGGVVLRWDSLSEGAKKGFPAGTSTRLIDFLRGDRSGEDAINGFRVRDSILGDFINGVPVYARASVNVENTRLPSIGQSYAKFVAGVKAVRDGVLYVGANDGMLHAFKETRGRSVAEDGKEIFAYVPQAVHVQLPLLAQRSYGSQANYHRYFVDGPLREADVWADGAWRNWLFGTTGAGARAVFAIDITDPAALGPESLRWEISAAAYPELGYIAFPIETGMLPDGRWVAVFGNGHGGASGQAVLFVVDLATKAVEQIAVGSPGTGNGLGGVAVARNADGTIASLYAGDQLGQLWRFDYVKGGTKSFAAALNGQPLFAAGLGKPLVQPPVLFEQSDGARLVVFGSGRLLTATDATDNRVQTVYGVADRGKTITPDQLRTRQLQKLAGSTSFIGITGEPVDWQTQGGWKIDLALDGFTGLRLMYAPQKADSRYVFISAVAPVQNPQPCDVAEGKGINLLFPAGEGKADTQPVFDVDGNGVINKSDALAVGYSTSADGQDRLVLGSTTVDNKTGAAFTKVSIQNTTGQTGAVLYRPASLGLRIVDRAWRRIANPPIR